MIEGLALPLYGFPTLAFFLGFVVLAPRSWARLAPDPDRGGGAGLVGLVAADDILWWLPIATYIGIVCLILWTPGATQWYRQRAALELTAGSTARPLESADGLVEHRVGLAERPPDVRAAGVARVVEHLMGDGHHPAAMRQVAAERDPVVVAEGSDVGGHEVGAAGDRRLQAHRRRPVASRSRLPCSSSRAAATQASPSSRAWATAGWNGAPDT